MRIYHYQTNIDRYECLDTRYEDNPLRRAIAWAEHTDVKEPLQLVRHEDETSGGRIAKKHPSCDLQSVSACIPLLSDRAWQVLRPLIEPHVTALSALDPSGNPYWLLNVNVIDALDSARAIVDGNQIRRHVFVADRLRGIPIFRVPQNKMIKVFVADEFKRTCNAAKLTGGLWDVVWTDEG